MNRPKTAAAWPDAAKFNEAIQNLRTSMSDEELQGGEAETNPIGIPMPYSGGFADVYKVHSKTTGQTWAVKCFKNGAAGLRERYSEISRHLQKQRLSFMVDFQYIESGVRIDANWYPIVKMRWVQGKSLHTFVAESLEQRETLGQLLELWVKLASRLRRANIAHADLQHGNVLLVPKAEGNLALRLIDYDGMFVPALSGAGSSELGHRNYQHPERLSKNLFNSEVDRFSHLAICCALRCLCVGGPRLWEMFDNGENLLFSHQDFKQPTESHVFRELWTLRDEDARALVGHLALATRRPLDQSPLIDELVVGGRVRQLSSSEQQQANSLISPASNSLPTGSGPLGRAQEATRQSNSPTTPTERTPVDELGFAEIDETSGQDLLEEIARQKLLAPSMIANLRQQSSALPYFPNADELGHILIEQSLLSMSQVAKLKRQISAAPSKDSPSGRAQTYWYSDAGKKSEQQPNKRQATRGEPSRTFDPYFQWLGIPPQQQPPNHYRLLGITEFEEDSNVITNAARRQRAHVLQIGSEAEFARHKLKIVNEIDKATACLLSQPLKLRYDAELRLKLFFSPVESTAPTIATFTDANFEREVLRHSQPVVVQFWANGSRPCQLLSPILQDLAEQNSGIAKVGKLNVGENPLTAARYNIQSAPSVLYYQNGQVQKRVLGVKPAYEYARDLTHLTSRSSAASGVAPAGKQTVAKRTPVTPKPPAAGTTPSKPADFLRDLESLHNGRPAPRSTARSPQDRPGFLPVPSDRKGYRDKVWGIEVGQAAFKAVRCEVENGVFIAKDLECFEYPKILSQPEANPEELIQGALEHFLSRAETKGHAIALSVPGMSALARFFVIPPVDPKRIPEIVLYEARQQIPFDLDDVFWDYQLMPGGPVIDGFAIKPEIGLFAIKKEALEKFIRPFKQCGLARDIVQMSSVAVENFVASDLLRRGPDEFDPDDPPESVAIVSMGADHSDLVLTNGFRLWQRSIPLGGNHFTRQLTREFKLTFAKAEHLKRNARQSADPRAVYNAMRPVFNDLVTEVQRSIGFFQAIDRKAKIAGFLLFGNATKLTGLSTFLEKNLGYEDLSLTTFPTVASPQLQASPAYQNHRLSLAVCYGLCLQGVGAAKVSANLLPKELRPGLFNKLRRFGRK